jgi:chemotaxis protein histidine kinase CheA
VEAHAGQVDIESRPGQGTRICARLPLRQAAGKPAAQPLLLKQIETRE